MPSTRTFSIWTIALGALAAMPSASDPGTLPLIRTPSMWTVPVQPVTYTPRWSCPPSDSAGATWISPPISTALRQFLMVTGPTARSRGSCTSTSPPRPSTTLSLLTPVTCLTEKFLYPAGGAQLSAPVAPFAGGGGSVGVGTRGGTRGTTTTGAIERVDSCGAVAAGSGAVVAGWPAVGASAVSVT